MAYLTVMDIDPTLIVDAEARPSIWSLSDLNKEGVGVNQRSFHRPLPVKRIARRDIFADALTQPLWDYQPRGSRYGTVVIDTAQFSKQDLADLRKFLPKHQHLVVDAENNEAFIGEKFDALDKLNEQAFQVYCRRSARVWQDYTTHRADYYVSYAWGKDYVGKTSGKALKDYWNMLGNDDLSRVTADHPFRDTEYAEGRYMGAQVVIVGIWKKIIAACAFTNAWQFDVHEDSHVVILPGMGDKARPVNLRNHKLKGGYAQTVTPTVEERDDAENIADLYERVLGRYQSSGSFHYLATDDMFIRVCRSATEEAFVKRLRPDDNGEKIKGAKRRIAVADTHNFSTFLPHELKEQNTDWMVFPLSLARGKPSIFTPNQPFPDQPNLTSQNVWTRAEAKLLVHHSHGIWRMILQVPFVYWPNLIKRYQMAALIPLTMENRECARAVPFPVSRGLTNEMKVQIENTPFMSSAIQHALYKLQFLLKEIDRDHQCTVYPFNVGERSQCLPTYERPAKLSPCKKYANYKGARHGTISGGYDCLNAFGKSDLWQQKEEFEEVQRVARALSVSHIDLSRVEPEQVRQRVLRLDA